MCIWQLKDVGIEFEMYPFLIRELLLSRSLSIREHTATVSSHPVSAPLPELGARYLGRRRVLHLATVDEVATAAQPRIDEQQADVHVLVQTAAGGAAMRHRQQLRQVRWHRRSRLDRLPQLRRRGTALTWTARRTQCMTTLDENCKGRGHAVTLTSGFGTTGFLLFA